MHHTRPVKLLIATILLATPAAAQNLYARAEGKASPIRDLRAGAVGDVLTIVISEVHKVTNEDKVERTNTTSLAARLEDYTLSSDTFKSNTLPRFDLRQQRVFDGESRQESDSDVRASIAVIVVDVQPNGNLVVAGSRVVTTSDETKTLRISGIVRPLDISATNTISSSQVADARISITGQGASTRYVTRGPVGALFDTLVWAAWPF